MTFTWVDEDGRVVWMQACVRRRRRACHRLRWEYLEGRAVLSSVSAGLNVLAGTTAAAFSSNAHGGRLDNVLSDRAGGDLGAQTSLGTSRGGPSAFLSGAGSTQGDAGGSSQGGGGSGYPVIPRTGPALQGDVVAQRLGSF